MLTLVVTVVVLERGADAVQIQTHLNFEVVHGACRHVGRVRIKGRGHAGQKDLDQVVVAQLVHPLGKAVVAAAEFDLGFGHVDLVGLLHEQVVLHAPAPAIGDLGLVLGPIDFLAIGDEFFVHREVVRLFQHGERRLEPFIDPLQVALIHGEPKADIPLRIRSSRFFSSFENSRCRLR